MMPEIGGPPNSQSPEAEVAAVLGHDPAVLLNTYASAVASGQRAAADVLGESLSVPILVSVESPNRRTTVNRSDRKPGKTKGIPTQRTVPNERRCLGIKVSRVRISPSRQLRQQVRGGARAGHHRPAVL